MFKSAREYKDYRKKLMLRRKEDIAYQHKKLTEDGVPRHLDGNKLGLRKRLHLIGETLTFISPEQGT